MLQRQTRRTVKWRFAPDACRVNGRARTAIGGTMLTMPGPRRGMPPPSGVEPRSIRRAGRSAEEESRMPGRRRERRMPGDAEVASAKMPLQYVLNCPAAPTALRAYNARRSCSARRRATAAATKMRPVKNGEDAANGREVRLRSDTTQNRRRRAMPRSAQGV